MIVRLRLRLVVLAACAAAALAFARPALAIGPLCDVRGASVAAPPPVLEVAPDEIDEVVLLPESLCALVLEAAASFGPDRDPRRAPARSWAPIDPAVRAAAPAVPGDGGARASPAVRASARVSAGHAPGVFRPPRRPGV